ncbi:MAG TPA: rRNA maturation RNase YbeY [Acidobacteriaceae bacterium]|jgi:probable rRNA maturation factor|nr:rRNA maturation RNase YbeY [Acidobacteriaceae bacterium]
MITLEARRGQTADGDAWAAAGLSRGGLARFLRSAQGLVGLKGGVDVLLADDRRLRELNREFRGKDKATDVLSFPAAEAFAGQHAGDLAISFDAAARQAAEHGHSLRDEVRVLMLHGLLHLNGMDHETDHGEMAKREAELRGRLRLPRGLIARTEGTTSQRARSGFPTGVTERKARAKTTANAKAKATAKTGMQTVSSFELRAASKDRPAIAKKRVMR